MDICIVSPGLLEAKTQRGGGIEEVNYRVGLHLSKYFNVALLSPFYRKYRRSLIIKKQFSIEELYFPAVKNYPPKSVLEKYMVFLSLFCYTFLTAVKLITLKKKHLRLIVLNDALTQPLSAILAKIMRVKVVYSEGNTYPWIMPYVAQTNFSMYKKFKWSLKLATCRLMCSLSDRIRSQSNSIMKGMTKYGVDSSKICVISAGVDVKIFKPLGEINHLDNNVKIGFIGRLTEEKGAPLLLKVIRMAVKKLPNVRFVLMGDGPCRRYFSGLPNIEHIGFVHRNRLSLWLSKVSIVVFFQKELGLAELEAMASDKAIIACNIGEVPRIIKHLENGLLCEPEAAGYINGIRMLVENPNLLKKLSKNARKTAISCFDWKVIGMRWFSLIYKLMMHID